jgi:GntR family transcriptional regulator, trigonelline degradation regulator
MLDNANEPTTGMDLAIKVGRVAAPLREQVVDLLREAILDFRLKPGQRLIERELIEQVGVSRTTIREVLRELAAEGLVTTIPQKGAIVVALSKKEAADLYEVRATLEALAGRRFAEHATDEQVTALRVAYEELLHSMTEDRENIKALLEAKDRFYDVFLTGAGNQSIKQILGGLQARVRLMRATSLSARGRAESTIAEIAAIIAAIEARDPDAAATACERHVNEAARIALGELEVPAPSAT